MLLLTWKCLYILGRQSSQYLSIDTNIILPKRIKYLRQFNQGQRRLLVRVKVLNDRVRPLEDILRVGVATHYYSLVSILFGDNRIKFQYPSLYTAGQKFWKRGQDVLSF